MKVIVPELIWPELPNRPITESITVLFPLPDSPTMPKVSPRLTLKLTSEAALTSPVDVKNEVLRFCTDSISSFMVITS